MGNLSRRDFLRLSGVGLAGLVNASLRIDRGFNWAAAIDWMLNLDSGVSQRDRKLKLEEAALKSVADAEIFSSLLKFEALQFYARQKGLVLSEATLRYFIYGDGQELDITDSVPESIKNYPDHLIAPWLSEEEIRAMTDEQLKQQWVDYSLGRISTDKLEMSLPPEKLRRKLEQGDKFYLEISGPGSGPNRDSFHSLNQFSQSFSGRVRRADKDSLGWKVDVAGAHYKLNDLYDFAKDRYVLSGQELYGREVLSFADEWLPRLGIAEPRQWLADHVGEEKIREFEVDLITVVDDRDGFRLQNASLGRSVPIAANWEFDRMDLRIPDLYLKTYS